MPFNSHYFQSRPFDIPNLSPPPTLLLSRSSIPSLSAINPNRFSQALKLSRSNKRRRVRGLRRRHTQFKAFDDNSFDIPLLDDLGHNEEPRSPVVSSSEGENSDAEYLVNPLTEVDLPTHSTTTNNNDAISLAAHRLGSVGRGHKRYRIKHGALLNTGLILFMTTLLLFVDYCAWRVVKIPLAPFHLTRPFLISAISASCAGYVCVPLLYGLKMYQIIRKEGPSRHSVKKRTPTLGGLFFVPIGVIVAKVIAGSPSPEVSVAAATTLAFGAIGLVDDVLILVTNHSSGLSVRIRILLEVAIGACFSFWLATASFSSPYGMKMLVPLPAPLGLVQLGKWYLILTSFCLVSMGNGVNLTDGLDGLAGGTAALAFAGMSIAVLPICPDMSIFGASMAGACVGFLLHNRYKASVFMGDTGSLALGGALASMAACTGMFFPLFISSGVFVIEAVSVIMQLSYIRATKRFFGISRRLFRMAPIHHHFELCGVTEPKIVAGAYIISSVLALFAAYVGLVSA